METLTDNHSTSPMSKQTGEYLINPDNAINGLGVRMVDGLRSNEKGIDMQRVKSFIEKLGLRVSTCIAIDADDVASLELLAREHNMPVQKDDEGAYIEGADLAFVVRKPILEELNGVGYTEATAVHELSHAAGRPMISQNGDKNSQQKLARVGSVLLNHNEGNFYEEAFAQLNAQGYISDVLGLENGFANEHDSVTVGFADGTELEMPGKYLISDGENRCRISAPSLAAYGIELLVQKDPQIRNALLESRKSVEGLRELARRIDALQPGLYVRLRKLPYSRQDFVNGVRYITEALSNAQPE